LYLWDDQNLYVGLRCLDRKPAHIGSDSQVWNGDAVEFYLDTRRGNLFGSAEYRPGTLHMFWTPFTGSELKPRTQVRDIPAFKDLQLEGAAVAGQKTPGGYTAEFKLPWANFPAFAPEPGEIIGMDCELCSSDGGPRVDRTFVYSSPAAVNSPAALGRVQLVEKIEPGALKPLGRVLLPLSLTKSANYDWLYGSVCVSPTIENSVAKLEGKIVDETGKVRKTALAAKRPVAGSDLSLWWQRWELFDLPPGAYTLEIAALDKEGQVITDRKEKLVHGGSAAGGSAPSKESDKSAAEKEDDKPPPAKKDDKPDPSKKSDKPPPAKESDKKSDKPPPEKEGDKKSDKRPPAKEGSGTAPSKDGDKAPPKSAPGIKPANKAAKTILASSRPLQFAAVFVTTSSPHVTTRE
jgi:hypothetical protein